MDHPHCFVSAYVHHAQSKQNKDSLDYLTSDNDKLVLVQQGLFDQVQDKLCGGGL